MMRYRLVGLMVLVIAVAGLGIAGADSQEVPRDEAYRKAREQMADLLASEEFEKVEIAAASFDRAMAMIYETVETYLDQVIPVLADVEISREFGVDVLQGLNEHRIRYSGDDGYDLAGKRHILIATEKDSQDLGELLGQVVLLIHSGHGKPGIDVRMAARRIFEGMLPVDGTQQPLVSQYLVRLKMLSKSDRKDLLRYALE